MTIAKPDISEVIKRLAFAFPEAHVELNYTNALELLVASVLAAQNTDTNVNKVTASLFRKYKTPQDYVNASPEELEQDIHSCGFFRQKTKSIRAICQKLIDDFGGNVPQSMDDLLSLPGIGRKTANVVLGYCFGIAEGIVIDTHNLRILPMLGLTNQKDAVKMEREMMQLVPRTEWINFGQRITWLGRRVCIARRPKCSECILNDICPSAVV